MLEKNKMAPVRLPSGEIVTSAKEHHAYAAKNNSCVICGEYNSGWSANVHIYCICTSSHLTAPNVPTVDQVLKVKSLRSRVLSASAGLT